MLPVLTIMTPEEMTGEKTRCRIMEYRSDDIVLQIVSKDSVFTHLLVLDPSLMLLLGVKSIIGCPLAV